MEAAAKDFYDCIVVGGGPAGLTAGIYLARACCRVLVIERAKFGGQITITQEVVNYPGAEPMSGTALTERMKQQAARFGAEFLAGEVLSLAREEDAWRVETNRGTLTATAVLLATGAHPRTSASMARRRSAGAASPTARPATASSSRGRRSSSSAAASRRQRRACSSRATRST